MTTTIDTAVRRADEFRHEALFYEGRSEFVDRTARFVRDGVEADEPVLVVVDAAKIRLLRDALGDASAHVEFRDMAEVGHNPARIIPAWASFVEEHTSSGRRFRGVGEPIWPERTPDELIECERHESLLNLAFASSSAWWLLCPYDTDALRPAVLAEARRNHPFVLGTDGSAASTTYRGLDDVSMPFDAPLPAPSGDAVSTAFAGADLHGLRSFVERHALRLGAAPARADDLVVAASEAAANSVVHGSGGGEVRVWRHDRSVVCEVRDGGHIADPMAGRRRPQPSQLGGFGLWLANQLCDLVQIRTFRDGSVVRLHVSAS